MAYSETLAERIRQALVHLPSVREQKMFGGLSFMVNEKLSIGIYKSGDMLVRCDPEATDELLTKEGVQWAEMKGKPMGKGWLLVSPEGMENQNDFDFWVDAALDFNRKRSQ